MNIYQLIIQNYERVALRFNAKSHTWFDTAKINAMSACTVMWCFSAPSMLRAAGKAAVCLTFPKFPIDTIVPTATEIRAPCFVN